MELEVELKKEPVCMGNESSGSINGVVGK